MLKKVPYGKVVTYKQIAKALYTRAYRAVGRAMHRNHDKNIPCHRVIKSNGEVGEYNLGRKKKILLLQKEGIEVKNGMVDLKKFGWRFSKNILPVPFHQF